MITAEKILTILWRINAAILLLALPTALLPDSWMSFAHGWFNIGEFPEQPIAEYLARSCSLLYGLHGGVLLLIGLSLRKHWSLVGPIALMHVALGLAILVTDLNAGMPWYWTAGEGIPIAIFGSILFLMWRKAGKEPN